MMKKNVPLKIALSLWTYTKTNFSLSALSIVQVSQCLLWALSYRLWFSFSIIDEKIAKSDIQKYGYGMI